MCRVKEIQLFMSSTLWAFAADISGKVKYAAFYEGYVFNVFVLLLASWVFSETCNMRLTPITAILLFPVNIVAAHCELFKLAWMLHNHVFAVVRWPLHNSLRLLSLSDHADYLRFKNTTEYIYWLSNLNSISQSLAIYFPTHLCSISSCWCEWVQIKAFQHGRLTTVGVWLVWQQTDTALNIWHITHGNRLTALTEWSVLLLPVNGDWCKLRSADGVCQSGLQSLHKHTQKAQLNVVTKSRGYLTKSK